MNLLSWKRELANLKSLAFSRRGSLCVCEYVELVDGQETTSEQERILENNSACYARHENQAVHTGWYSITIPAKCV
jgi:hypothetical protein